MFSQLRHVPYLNRRLSFRAIVDGVSFDITVTVEDGTVSATMHGGVPDGEYRLTGWHTPAGWAVGLAEVPADVTIGMCADLSQS